MINQMAPVIIFTYNRLDTLKVTIENLRKNKLALDTTLFIFSDYAKKEKDQTEIKKIREYLHTIEGFKSIKIIEREKNYGLAKNIIEGVTEIINIYGKVIVLEDDLLTSKNFLSYMNQALDFYKENEKIFSISGYTGNLPNLKNLKKDSYISYRPSSWGWATWKKEWNKNDWEVKDFDIFIKDKKAIKKFNRGGIDLTRMLKNCMEGKNHSWAIRWAYTMNKIDKFCVYPKTSKIQNIGFGEEGTNCTGISSGINIYKTILDESENFKFNFTDDMEPIKKITDDFKYQFSYSNKLIKKSSEIVKFYFNKIIK